MERSSRRVALTAAGRVLHERSVSLLSNADALMESLREERDEPQSLVRITAPDKLGAHLIEHLLPQVLQRYPRLRFAVKLDYDFDDMLEPSIDLAFRVGQVHDDRLVARVIGSFSRICVASPRYLAAHPVHKVADLADRACLTFSDIQTSAEWTLRRGRKIEEVRVNGPIAVRSFTALMQAARAGVGIARAPEFAVQPLLEKHELVRVLPEWRSIPTEVFAVHRFGHERIRRIGAVLEVLSERSWPLV